MYQISVDKLPIGERHSCQMQATHSSGCVGIWSIDFPSSSLLFNKIINCQFKIQFVHSGNQQACHRPGLPQVKSDFYVTVSSKFTSTSKVQKLELIKRFVVYVIDLLRRENMHTCTVGCCRFQLCSKLKYFILEDNENYNSRWFPHENTNNHSSSL